MLRRAARGGRRRVLHVDDDEAFLDLASSFLERELDGAAVATATRADAVLDALDSEDGRPDCIVSDYEMPGTDGLELFEAVRGVDPHLPFILYTSKGSEEIAGRAVNAGVTGYLQKGGPEQHRRLANRVAHAIDEHRAKMESDRYSTVLRALDYPVYVVDETGRFTFVNDAFVRLTGYDRGTLLGARPSLIKSEAGVRRAEEALATILSDDGPDTRRFGVEIRPKHGDPIPCRDHMGVLPYEGAQFRGSAGILRDVSGEERRRRELERQDERLDEFRSIVSHDFRAPLRAGRDAAEGAASADGAAERERHLRRLDRAHGRMERLIDGLLRLARCGRPVEAADAVELAAAAADTWADVDSDGDGGGADGRDADLVVTAEAAVEADRERLRELLAALFENAVEHGGASVVRVGELDAGDGSDASDDGDGGAGFYVADDGSGFPVADRGLAFDPGYTAADDPSRGFGLAVVRHVARAHGWDVRVREAAGGGTRVEVTGVALLGSAAG